MKKYSVIMPIYNSEKTLYISINSILNQNYKNWELIAIDDGSTDDSLKILEKLAKKDKRIKVVHQKNSGPGHARNNGINIATGDYICFLDSDDYYEPNYFEIINNINKNNNFDLIYIGRIQEQEDGKITNVNDVTKFQKYDKDELIKLQLMGILPWGPCIKLGKSEIIKQCKFSNLEVGEELIYSFNVLKKSKKIAFLDKNLYHYVYNENGQHKKGGIDPWGEVTKALKEYLSNIGEYEKYSDAVNGLALRALTIAIYRCSCEYKYNEAKQKIKNIIKMYQGNYELNNTDSKLMDKTSKLIFVFIKLRLFPLLYIASKIKNR